MRRVEKEGRRKGTERRLCPSDRSPRIERSSRGGGATGDPERGSSEVARNPGKWCCRSKERRAFQGESGHSCGVK